MTHTERVALFPGTFNPFTVGHADIIQRGLEIFDRIVIGIGLNGEKIIEQQMVGSQTAQTVGDQSRSAGSGGQNAPSAAPDSPLSDTDARLENIRSFYQDNPRVSVMAYTDLTVDAARRVGATCLLRGLRTGKDFEYERDIADINRRISGLDTVMLFTNPQYQCISSRIVRDLQRHGKDMSAYLPKKS